MRSASTAASSPISFGGWFLQVPPPFLEVVQGFLPICVSKNLALIRICFLKTTIDAAAVVGFSWWVVVSVQPGFVPKNRRSQMMAAEVVVLKKLSYSLLEGGDSVDGCCFSLHPLRCSFNFGL